MERRKKQKAEYEKVMIRDSMTQLVKKEKDIAVDSEIQAFVDMLTKVRSKYKHSADDTNPGIIFSPKIQSAYPANTSVKLVVRFGRYFSNDNVVKFTCDGKMAFFGRNYALTWDFVLFFQSRPSSSLS